MNNKYYEELAKIEDDIVILLSKALEDGSFINGDAFKLANYLDRSLVQNAFSKFYKIADEKLPKITFKNK